jgi:hypothetical protein
VSDLSIADLLGKKIILIGSTVEEVQGVDKTIEESSKGRGRGRQNGPLGGSSVASQPRRNHDWRKAQEEAQYTFVTLRPLQHLPNPSRSLAVLQRLKDDAGIKATMRKHKWTVPLLTEMDPAEHTTHQSKTLGLNRNAGEVIELRLRTDAYDGYRDYKSIRKTLCHELAHNVHGPHDSKFWTLCKQIEQEVDRGDWRSGGHALSNEEFYEPEGDEEHVDGGGWIGGEYVLGSTGTDASATEGLSRREILARAAEERMKQARNLSKGKQTGTDSDDAAGSSSS